MKPSSGSPVPREPTVKKRAAGPGLHMRREFTASAAKALLALFDHLPEVYLFVKDSSHRFVAANRALWKLHGCESEKEMLGKTDADFHPPLLAQQYVAEDMRVLQRKKPLVNQVWLVTGADGLPRWFRSTKTPVFDATGAAVGVAGILQSYESAGEAPGEYGRLTPAFEHVLKHYGEPISIEKLANLTGLSVSQFQRTFRRLFKRTPNEYVNEVRLQAARRALERSRDSIGLIAADCGFYDQSYFVKRFKAATGLRPLEYRKRFAR